MRCLHCNAPQAKVTDSRSNRVTRRLTFAGNEVRRRRECPECKNRFTTYEVTETALNALVENGRRWTFIKEWFSEQVSADCVK